MINHSSGTHVSHVKVADYETVTQAIVASVASLEDCDRTELPVLFGASAPDALDMLFEKSLPGEDLTLQLTLGQYEVICEKSGAVTSRRID